MPTLYHYSPVVHLPPILREGLSQGDIAHPDPSLCEQAVSLTTQHDPDRLCCWGAPLPFKTAVRYVCRLDEGDPLLEPARDAWQRLGVPPKVRRAYDPNGQSKWWSFYHGVIAPSRFTVELRGRSGYVAVPAAALGRVVEAVNAERDKHHFVVRPEEPFIQRVVAKDPGAAPSWLLREVFPAERFELA